MAIKAYLFTNMARQINHTYYSLENNKFLYFYHNLIDYHNEIRRILIRPFVYEVEIKPEAVLECEYLGLTATEFKIVREVKFIELVNTYEFSTVTKNEIYSILNGTAESRNVTSLYERVIQKSKWNLSEAEQFKLLAILNQNHYELPVINITNSIVMEHIRLLKFFNKPYTSPFTDSIELDYIKKEELYGRKDFEIGIDLPMSEVICHIHLRHFIKTRKLSQEQFEKLCSLYKRDILTFNFRVKSAAILAGYKILPEYRKLFYPFVLYHGVENCLDLIEKESKSSEPLYALFYCGYKFKNFDYSNMPWNKEVSEAKTIFQNGFKYIE